MLTSPQWKYTSSSSAVRRSMGVPRFELRFVLQASQCIAYIMPVSPRRVGDTQVTKTAWSVGYRCNDKRPLSPPEYLRQVVRPARKRYQYDISSTYTGHLSTRTMSSSFSSPNSPIPKIRAGDGRIVVEFDPYRGHTFAQLSCTYPLKLLSPRSKEDSVAIVYVLSYGGGLVGGDEVQLEVGVREGASLMLLSQVRPLSYLRGGTLIVILFCCPLS